MSRAGRARWGFRPTAFLDLISGRRRGPGAAILRGTLWLLQAPYGLAVVLRNRRYDRRPHLVRRVAVPVISIGNLTTGGTGKTPLVAWVARWLRDRQLRVALVSRGYGAQHGGVNDEALELEQQLPDVPHVQNPDRASAAELAIEEFFTQVIVLDDAFQHRRIHRDLDVVLLDALQPFGFNHLLPRGLMREPLRGLRRAHAVGLSRADLINEPARAALRSRLQQFAPQAVYFEVAHRPAALLAADGTRQSLEQLRNTHVLAFCGIGNPEGFRRTLQQLGCHITDLRIYPDHHNYDRDDVRQLLQWAAAHAQAPLTMCICTRKDLVKIALPQLGPIPLRALAIEIEFLSGQQDVERLLSSIAQRAPRDVEQQA